MGMTTSGTPISTEAETCFRRFDRTPRAIRRDATDLATMVKSCLHLAEVYLAVITCLYELHNTVYLFVSEEHRVEVAELENAVASVPRKHWTRHATPRTARMLPIVETSELSNLDKA